MTLQEKIQKKAEGYGKLSPVFLEGAKFALEHQWINVESKLPCNDGNLFLIYCKVYRKENNIISNEHYEIYLAYFDKDDLSWYGMIDYNNYDYDVLYWMPIPEPPKE